MIPRASLKVTEDPGVAVNDVSCKWYAVWLPLSPSPYIHPPDQWLIVTVLLVTTGVIDVENVQYEFTGIFELNVLVIVIYT